MTVRERRVNPWRRATASGSALGLILALAACGGAGSGVDVDCAPYAAYGSDHGGAKVHVASSIRNVEGQRFIDTLSDFETCTGIDIVWDASGSFESDLQKNVKAGHAPDLAALSQPGLVKQMVEQGAAKPASAAVTAAATQNYPEQFRQYGTVNGRFYSTPLGANVKSLVWYSPVAFQQNGWGQPPTTWAAMMALTARIANVNHIHPWCAGIESGTATGWPATDWVEDVVLRFEGVEVYDKWVAHQIPFNDPRIIDAINRVGDILRDNKFVNGGFGDHRSIAKTSFQDGGLPIVDSGDCAMHRQASFLANEWPSSVEVGENADVYAFYLPSVDGKTKPLLVGGEFLTPFNTKPETQAVQLYMSSPEFTNKKAKLGEWISANKGLSPANIANPVDKLSVALLNAKAAVIRFDASDMMPGAVGAGSFWTEMTAWIAKDKSTKDVADAIEASWPK